MTTLLIPYLTLTQLETMAKYSNIIITYRLKFYYLKAKSLAVIPPQPSYQSLNNSLVCWMPRLADTSGSLPHILWNVECVLLDSALLSNTTLLRKKQPCCFFNATPLTLLSLTHTHTHTHTCAHTCTHTHTLQHHMIILTTGVESLNSSLFEFRMHAPAGLLMFITPNTAQKANVCSGMALCMMYVLLCARVYVYVQ